MTDRLEIASRALQGLLADVNFPHDLTTGRAPSSPQDAARINAEHSLMYADAILAAASQSGSDASDMARTIQRLEQRVAYLRQSIRLASADLEHRGFGLDVAKSLSRHLEEDNMEANHDRRHH